MDAGLLTETRGLTRRPVFADSKFAIPEPGSAMVLRPALLRRLDEGASADLTTVIGPAGSGKTTLLLQWARRQLPGSVSWLSCDHGDHEPIRFWHAFVGAVARTCPGFGDECLDLLALNGDVDHDVLESLLTACSALDRPHTLVVDDLQFTGPAVHEQLRFVVPRGLGRLRLLTGSRTELPIGADRLRVTGHVCELSEIDLRFSAADAAVLLRRDGIDASGAELDVIMQRTEGWAAGLELVGVALRDVGHREDLIARLDASNRFIGQYLWSEVFDAQTADVQRFLLDTCIVDVLTSQLAATLSPGTPVTLLDIERANLLLLRLDPAGTTFRYHHLLSDMLRARLRATEPEREFVLHERAARHLLDRGDNAAAFRHRWRAGHRTAAIAPMHGVVLENYYDDLLPSFDESERTLSDDDLLAAPGPAISYCVALAARGFVEDAARVGARVEQLAGPDLSHADLQQIRGLRAIVGLAVGDTQAATRHADAVLDDQRGDPADAEWVPLSASVAARAHTWHDEHDVALRTIEALTKTSHPRLVRTEITGTVAFCQLSAGNLGPALAQAETLIDELTRSGAAMHDVGVQPMAVLGSVLLDRGDLPAAERWLREAGSSPSALRYPARALARIGMSRILRADGDFDGAFAVLDDTLQPLRFRPPGSGIVDRIRAQQARVLLDSGDLDAASAYIDGVASSFGRELLAARRSYCGGEIERAREQLAALSARATCRRQRLDVALLVLATALAAGDRTDELAAEVLDLAEPEHFVLPIAEAGAEVLQAVREVARKRPSTTYHETLMAVRPSAPPPTISLARWSFEQLTDRERAVLRYLATSMTYQEIADALYVSVNTVKTHAKNITRKLQASSRAEALARARQLRYL